MRYVDTNFKTIDESLVDLSSGRLVSTRVLKEVLEKPIDNITKFAYEQEDYEDAFMFIPKEEETIRHTKGPTQLDIIEAQVTYTAMMTDTLLEG